ncbi:MBOAT family O-acyltransferase [Flammeovirga sp. SubArs3]|uniref:MBOAT family O-acyltransferase n=1 Tax=Flammeovirga sp. SubArs3 TaxID=2995316 RepID=UPI00248AD619|nr:MBOAT family O-acyltransferase [Flammeovirga sp. SubArs3]
MPFFSIQYFIIISLSIVIDIVFKKKLIRNSLLLVNSYFFYYQIDPNFLILLIVLTIYFYVSGFILNREKSRKIFLIVFIVPIVSIFFFLKTPYLFNLDINGIIIPVGFSFYSLQGISYLVDIYNKKRGNEKSLLIFSLYLSFFPQILAGPIERSNTLIPQLKNRGKTKSINIRLGSKHILYGLFCKYVIANQLYSLLNPVLLNYTDYSSISLFINLLMYYMYIFFDFQGYTMIAIGSANLLGITLTKNFNKPYIASSIKDFWHRWHQTLSMWFKDYIYIPLGGNRTRYFQLNIILVFILSGIWHGNTINYLIWGVFHSALYLIEYYLPKNITQSICYRCITLALIIVSWVPFFYQDTHLMSSFIIKLFLFESGASLHYTIQDYTVIFITLIGLIIDFKFEKLLLQKHTSIKMKILEFVSIDIMLVSVLLLGTIGVKEFLYFRF